MTTKRDVSVVVDFHCPKELVQKLDLIAELEYATRSAVLRKLIVQAAVPATTR